MARRKNPGRLLGRRRAMSLLALSAAAAAGWWSGRSTSATSARVSRSRVLMGAVVNFMVVGDDRESAEAAIDATFARMSGLEARLSRHRPDSEVSRLNRSGRLDGAGDDLLEVLRLARRVSELGDGAFDITVAPVSSLYRQQGGVGVPDADAVAEAREFVDYRGVRLRGRDVALARTGAAIDLDGIGKGYVVDRGVDVLRRWGYHNVIVEAGGDLVTAGKRADGEPWRIGIRSPRGGQSGVLATLVASDVAVATSGDYMQAYTSDFVHHHVIDPRTGYSSLGVASATVLAPDAALADALATLAMTLNLERMLDLVESLPGCDGYFVRKNLEVARTSGLMARMA